MKWVFLVCAIVLAAASYFTWRSMPEQQSRVPVIYWVTDPNPARFEQINLFHRWLIENGHTQIVELNDVDDLLSFRQWVPPTLVDDVIITQPETAAVFAGLLPPSFRTDDAGVRRPEFEVMSSETGRAFLEANPKILDLLLSEFDTRRVKLPLTLKLPRAEMRLDTGNTELAKRIIQGVSGVGGEVWDVWTGNALRPLQEIGLCYDVTEQARALGFDYTKTYEAVGPELCVPNDDGELRQYLFPCNVATNLMIVNVDTFEKYSQEIPPERWTIDEFERRGKAFVAAANADPNQRHRVFFANDVQWPILLRSFGGALMDETLSGPALDRPEAVRALELKRKWIFDDRILPSPADIAAATTESGYGGVEAQLFGLGRYAMIQSGRWRMISFRQFNIARVRRGEKPMKLSVSEPPYDILPNTTIGARAAMVYVGAPHRDDGVLFQAFLASESYNRQIVRDADALPPVPKYTQSEEFLRPPLDVARGVYPETEWDFHERFINLGPPIGIGGEHSRFINATRAAAEESRAIDSVMSNILPPAQALADAARRMNVEIERNLRDNPSLRPLYKKLRDKQQRIDKQRAAIEAFIKQNPGRPLPDELKFDVAEIDNPVFKKVYQIKGWLRE